MNRILAIKPFVRWADGENIPAEVLCKAVAELEAGLIDADLGGNVYKKRIAHSGRGKRGGARTIIATRFEGKFFFLAGFAKNERDNLSKRELVAVKIYAQKLLLMTDQTIEKALEAHELKEVVCNEPDSE